jgi:peptidoglycan/xylan/chitin deacetylase (PgdA/CDA1 family)
VITLLYHDVVEPGQADTSGFPGPGAARYKLTPRTFREHLAALAGVLKEPATPVAEAFLESNPGRVLITFDDGGKSALEPIADVLEEHGWRGHFFVTSQFIGTPPFLSAEQIRLLHRRGHVIGSHSHSHPQRMALCPWDQLVREWSQSCEILADILEAPVTVASVPGGFYSRKVAEAAALAGIRVLFNSEPTTRIAKVNGCWVLGRYTLYDGMNAGAATALVARWPGRRWGQAVTWKMKKAAKNVGGRAYLALRERLLGKVYGNGK